jgi:hypothetical protein
MCWCQGDYSVILPAHVRSSFTMLYVSKPRGKLSLVVLLHNGDRMEEPGLGVCTRKEGCKVLVLYLICDPVTKAETQARYIDPAYEHGYMHSYGLRKSSYTPL